MAMKAARAGIAVIGKEELLPQRAQRNTEGKSPSADTALIALDLAWDA
jgi:hypothetical protein